MASIVRVSLKVPYKKLPLPNGDYTYHAILNVQIARHEKNAPRTKRFEAVVDSGASRCVFHSSIGESIGLDVKKGQVEETRGISGEATPLYLHEISFYAPGGVIQIRAAFTDNLPVAGVLGMRGFFEHFRVIFDAAAGQLELERIYKA